MDCTAAPPEPLSKLAAFVAGPLPEPGADVLTALRNAVVDTIGCVHAGCAKEVAARTRRAVSAMGGTGPARIIGTRLWAPRPQAAFLNAVAGHALDFDDWEIPGNTHPSVVMVPALLAAAEVPVTGRHLAEAYIVGFEVIARLGETLNFEHYDNGWHTTATLGAFGAAAAVARLLGLDAGRTGDALALAASSATGFTCQFGSDAKPIQAGFAARAGVEAAFLARAGCTAQAHVLTHARGFGALTGGLSFARLDAALARLGEPLALAQHGIVLKPWPTCGYTHRAMSCALALHDRVAGRRIASIEIALPDFHAAVLPFRAPTSRVEALFSLPFVVAMGIARGDITLADLDRGAWRDAPVADLIARTAVSPFTPARPDMNYAPEDPDRLTITMADGTRYEASCVYPFGAPQAPMSTHAVRAKLAANCGSAAPACLDALFDWIEADDALALLTRTGDRR